MAPFAKGAIGLDGALLSWVDYEDGLRHFNDGVLTLLERAGSPAPVQTPRAVAA